MRDDEKNLSMNYGPSVLSLKIIRTNCSVSVTHMRG